MALFGSEPRSSHLLSFLIQDPPGCGFPTRIALKHNALKTFMTTLLPANTLIHYCNKL